MRRFTVFMAIIAVLFVIYLATHGDMVDNERGTPRIAVHRL